MIVKQLNVIVFQTTHALYTLMQATLSTDEDLVSVERINDYIALPSEVNSLVQNMLITHLHGDVLASSGVARKIISVGHVY